MSTDIRVGVEMVEFSDGKPSLYKIGILRYVVLYVALHLDSYKFTAPLMMPFFVLIIPRDYGH